MATDSQVPLRVFSTEPVMRLDVKNRGNAASMQEKASEIIALIDGLP